MTVTDDASESPDPVIRWQAEVGTVYDLVSASPRIVFQEVGFLLVKPLIVLRVQDEAGLNVAGFVHIMDTDSIRHILKAHGDEKETLRGQIPLVRDDFLRLPAIFEAPDTIKYGGKTKPGRDTLKYVKTLGDFTYFYMEELRTKKNRLAAVTFYKRKISGPTPDAPS